MKKPKISNLKINNFQTKRIQSAVARSKSIKITINLDSDSLGQLKELSDASGVPYQRLLNRILKEGLTSKDKADSRLDKIEKDLLALKKKLVA